MHFCQRAFDIYTRLTTIDQLLGNEVENLRGLKYFFQNSVFLWIFVLLALLSAVWLLIFPKEHKQDKFDDDDVRRARVRADAWRGGTRRPRAERRARRTCTLTPARTARAPLRRDRHAQD